jgi:MYXO-CTERM domain-containing protein
MARTSTRSHRLSATLALGSALFATSLTHTAAACGGFFCSATPVDQTAERIIFSVNPESTVTAYINIQYAGERDAFAWIVPVPSPPDLGEFPQGVFNAIDVATQPQFFNNQCFFGQPGGAPTASPDSNNEGGSPGVTIINREQVGAFDTVTLEGDTADVLIEWLQMNDYRITTKMQPFIQEYIDDGMMFVAMKLLPDAQVADIAPISMTYQGDRPMIPIRLTTVAAQPEMGIKAWIFGSRRFGPENYQDLTIEDASIQIDPNTGRNNYLTVVSRSVDQVGGQAFVTEYAQSTAGLLQQIENQFINQDDPDTVASSEALTDLLRRFPYLTRLYTRMSAEEMQADPSFQPAANQADVSNIHDLTPEGEPQDCNITPPPPPPCAFTYCGRQGVCVPTTDGQEGCACAAGEGSTARPTTTGVVGVTNGAIDVYCEPMDLNLSDPMEDEFSTVCEGFDCGTHGECVLMNGNPTCRCEQGYAASAQMTVDPATGTGRVTMACNEVDGAVPELPLLPRIGEPTVEPGTGTPGGTPNPGNGNNGGLAANSKDNGGCSVGRGPSTSSAWGALALLMGLALVRRNKRS